MSHTEKLARAEAHLNAFQDMALDFLKRDPYTTVIDLHPKRLKNGHQGIEIIVHLKKRLELPPDLPAILGDAVANMRSALDHLAYELTVKNLSQTGGVIDEGAISFPIHGDSSAFAEKGPGTRAISQMSQDVQDIIKRMQPYPGARGSKHRPLGVLNKLSNIDKHRHFLLNGSISMGMSFSIDHTQSRNISATVSKPVIRYGLFSDQTDVARMLVEVTGPNAQVKVDPHGPLDVAFPQSGPAAGEVVLAELGRIYFHIRDVVFPPLEEYLK